MKAEVKNIAFAAFLITALLLSGCMTGVPLEELLKPPKLSDEQLEIYSALMKGKSGNITLKYPRSGDYRSAFVTADFADDEKSGGKKTAAIVFYEMSGVTSESTLWLNFLDRNDSGEWESVYDLSLKGTDIDRINFLSLGDDKGVNILVSYIANQSEKAFVLLRYKDRVPMKLIEGQYSHITSGEFLNRGMDELLVLRNDYTLETASASFYTWKEGRFISTGSFDLDPTAGEYTSITQGKLNESITALFINHRKKSNRDHYGTDVIYTRGDNTLQNLILQNEENEELVLRRTNSYTELANPTDINGDGFVELCGSTGEFPGYSALSSPDKISPVIWRSYVLGQLSEIHYSYYSEKNGFVFLFPNRWRNSVTVKVSADGRQISFYEAVSLVNDADKELLTFAAVHEYGNIPEGGDWVLYDYCDETKINYYIRTPNTGDPLSLTADELSLSFRILSRIDDKNGIVFK